MLHFVYSHSSTAGLISGLEEEVKEVKSSLSKVQTEKTDLQAKLNGLEKVGVFIANELLFIK